VERKLTASVYKSKCTQHMAHDDPKLWIALNKLAGVLSHLEARSSLNECDMIHTDGILSRIVNAVSGKKGDFKPGPPGADYKPFNNEMNYGEVTAEINTISNLLSKVQKDEKPLVEAYYKLLQERKKYMETAFTALQWTDHDGQEIQEKMEMIKTLKKKYSLE
jgi:DNA repair ATPase RecN